MTKTAAAKVIGLAAALALVLTFSATHATQAASKPSVRWQATFATEGSATLGPDSGGTYYGGVNGVSITNGQSSCGNGNEKFYFSYLEMRVAPTRHVDFSALPVTFQDWFGPEPGDVVPGFPGVGSASWPANLAEFLSSPQPYDGTNGGVEYQYVSVRFSTCDCENRTSTDLLQMPVGTTLRANVQITIFSHAQTCPPEDPSNLDYNVNMRAHGYQPVGETSPDVSITRDTTSQWTAHVNSMLENPAYQDSDWPLLNDFVEGMYTNCTLKSGRGGKTSWSADYIEAATKARLTFDLQFTKY
jgi:hypothetical protein